MIKIAPSILAADLLKLEEQIKLVAENGADYIHIDVMDGHFVPNLTFGTNMVKAVKRITEIPLDVHLMISNPDSYIEDYAKAGADILTVHQEACTHLHRTIQIIHQNGMKAGVALNPATTVDTLANVISELELILIMTVNPGFGGQKFIKEGLNKIKKAREIIDETKPEILLEVDGGVNPQTAKDIAKNGANLLVAGSAVFKKPDILKAMNEIKKVANNAY